MTQMTIEHTETETRGKFRLLDESGTALGEMTYSRAGTGVIIIDHTESYPGNEGRGVGKRLVAAGVAHAREHGLQIVPLCTFAHAVFERTPEYADVWKNHHAQA